MRKWYVSTKSYPEQKIGYENTVQCTVHDFLARDEVPQPQDWSKSGSKLAGSLGSVSISLPSIPTIPIPELDIFSAWKIVLLWTRINNKRLLSHMLFFSWYKCVDVDYLFPPNANWLSLLVLMVLHLSWRTEDNQGRTKWKCHDTENNVSYLW